MISRNDLLKIERSIFSLINQCSDARKDTSEDSAAYQLVVTLEHECHGMVKRISDITEGAWKEVRP